MNNMKINHFYRLAISLVLFVFLSGSISASPWKCIETVKVGTGKSLVPEVSIEKKNDGREIYTVTFNSYDIWEYRHLRETFTSVEFPGCGYYQKPGDPEVAIWSKIIKLAPGEKLIFEDAEYKWSPKEIYGRWMPSQKAYSDMVEMKTLAMNEKTYRTKGDVFQDSHFTLSAPRKIWNSDYLSISLQPFQYFPLEGRIVLLQEAKIIFRRLNSPKNDANTEKVKKQHSGYLVITPERFLKKLTPFLNFKKKQHPDLKVLTLEEIGSTVADIDREIEKAGSRGTRFTLLVGHTSILPSQGYKSPWNETGKDDCKDADFIYRNHGNNPFPSYMIGRFPVVSEEELETVIAKTLRRWQNPETYQNKPMLIAHEQEAPGKYQGCVQNILNTVIENSRHKLAPKIIFPSSIGNGGLDSRKEDFYDALQSGVGVMLYRGHGGADCLATKYLQYWGSRQEHWYEMKAAIPPVFYSVACLNGQLTNENGERIFGLCENLLTANSFGVAATIGAIQPSPTVPNHTFAWNLMYYTYTEPQKTIGEVFQKSMLETMKFGFANVESSRQWEWIGDLYNLYGDPELPVTKISAQK